tara:strand:+ start:2977 stop:3486 length:510 start_codon:yes stop_codon:yes gene_type:complete
MKNTLIISATSFSNYDLSEKIQKILKQINVNSDIINLEDYNLPLFLAKDYKDKINNVEPVINEILKKFIKASGIIICAPEYNGSIPPIITNFIAWLSVSTDNWRDAFSGKIGIVASSSGGDATKYIISMKNQLEHLGVVTIPRNINISSKYQLNVESAKKILVQFANLL